MQYGGSESVLLTTDDVILYTPQTQQNTIVTPSATILYRADSCLHFTHQHHLNQRHTKYTASHSQMLLVGNIILLTSFRHDWRHNACIYSIYSKWVNKTVCPRWSAKWGHIPPLGTHLPGWFWWPPPPLSFLRGWSETWELQGQASPCWCTRQPSSVSWRLAATHLQREGEDTPIYSFKLALLSLQLCVVKHFRFIREKCSHIGTFLIWIFLLPIFFLVLVWYNILPLYTQYCCGRALKSLVYRHVCVTCKYVQ